MPRGRKTKFRPDQTQFLEDNFQKYKANQRLTKLPKFWQDTEALFFGKWPEEDELGIVVVPDDGSAEGVPKMSDEDATRLGTSTKARRLQIRAWYNNQDQKRKRAGAGVNKAGDLAVKLFQKNRSRRRKLQEVEIYQQRNPEKVKATVKAAQVQAAKKTTKKHKTSSSSNNNDSRSSSDDDSSSSSDYDSSSSSSDDDSDDKGEAGTQPGRSIAEKKGPSPCAIAMSLRREVTQKLFDAESAEERSKVQQLYEDQLIRCSVGNDLAKDISERTPQEIQNAIEEFIGEFHACIERLTGWTGMTLLGGPMPEEGGHIATKSLPKSLPIWDDLLKATGQWLKTCNNRDVRKSRALIPAEPTEASSHNAGAAAPTGTTEDDAVEPLSAPAKSTKGKGKAGGQKTPTARQVSASRARAEKGNRVPDAVTAVQLLGDPDVPTPSDFPSDTADESFGEPDALAFVDFAITDSAYDDTASVLGMPPPGLGFPDQAPPQALQGWMVDTPGDENGAGLTPEEIDDIPIDPFLTTPQASSSSIRGAPPLPARSEAASGAGDSPLVRAFGLSHPPPSQGTRHSPTVHPAAWTPRAPVSMDTVTPFEAWTPRAPVSMDTVTPFEGLHHAQNSSPLRPGLTPYNAPVTTLGTQRAMTSSPLARSVILASSTLTWPAPAAQSTVAPTTPTAHDSITPGRPILGASSSPTRNPSAPAPGSADLLIVPPPVPPPLTAPLSANNFLQSRPMCKPPMAPRSGGRGAPRGRGGGRGGKKRGGAADHPPGAFLQTYDDDGNIVPLPLGTQVEGVPSSRRKQIRDMEKERDGRGDTATGSSNAAPSTPLHLRNPDGTSDLLVTGSRPPNPRPEDIIRSKRVRKPAASREMPEPLTKDTKQKLDDAALAKKLQKSTTDMEKNTASKKRARADGKGDENAAPAKRRKTRA
ncbi:hypothetical protein DFH07DRAFT_958289 [Mycena maculata]|uniref:Uncharacterized protein n=1 Tax=Mycena maculata TaxID=230809 RepID=A0AAD7NFD2_9AGAR|nr:hypothetical protein DFH07DRAFT_958289 [Mycena maculata]